MGLNKSKQAHIDNRRARVSALVLRGLTQREIVMQLEKMGVLNPETGKAYSLGTINSDMQHLERQWRAEARRSVAEHKARLIAETREARRLAWSQQDVRSILRGIQQEAKLTGAEEPLEIEMSTFDLQTWQQRRQQRLADVAALEDILDET